MSEFLQRLRERKLVQWAIAYVAAAFALLQGIDIVAQQFGWPEGVRRGITLAMVVGFFVTLVLAWYHGERGAQKVTGLELLILALLLSLGGAFLWRFAATSEMPKLAAVVVPAASPSATAPKPVPLPEIPEKSIAVLPFENLSDDKSNSYFAEGVQDEILTRLAKIGDLKVISRTSSAQYQSRPLSLTLIAQQLGVANILEGSVQKAGDTVHINVQLIKAATDAHLWAESYDRELKNIFAVEGEVAGKIAEALDARLTGSERKAITEKPTDNMAAYKSYLRGLSIEQSHFSYESWAQAAAAQEEATGLDPQFALAWAHLADMRSLLYLNGVAPERYTAASVKEAADKAISLQPDLGEAWVAQAYYRRCVLRDLPGALKADDEARRRLPNNSLVLMSTANTECRLGRWEEAVTHYRKAAELDPRNLQIFEVLGDTLGYLRRYDDALTAYDMALAISPNEEDVPARKANVLLSAGRLQEADREMARRPLDSTNDVVRFFRLKLWSYERRFDKAIALVANILSSLKPGEPADTDAKVFMVQSGYLLEWSGRPNESKTAFARALHAIKPTPETIVPADADGLPSLLASVYAGLDQKEKALTQARQAVQQYQDDAVDLPQAEITLAQIEARFRETDAAIAALPHLLTVPAGLSVADLQYDPSWDPIRKDARFQALLAKRTNEQKHVGAR